MGRILANKENSKNIENNKSNINNIFILKAKKEIKIEKVERIIKINKNNANIQNGGSYTENQSNPKTEIILSLPEVENEFVSQSKIRRNVIEISMIQPRNEEIGLPKRLICEEKDPILSKKVELQSKEIMKVGNYFIRVPKEDARITCEYFCDYLNLKDPQYLADINKEIYEDLIRNQVKKVFLYFKNFLYPF